MNPQRRWQWIAAAGTALLLALALLLQAAAFRRAKSATYDETYYLSAAQQTVHACWLDHKLSDNGVGAVPIMLAHVPAAVGFAGPPRRNPWDGAIDDPPYIARARQWNAAVIGVPLVLTVFVWLLLRRGLGAAAVGGVLMAFSPTVVAHSSLATTDAAFALFGILALAYLVWYLRRPGWGRLVLLSAAVGVAIGAKYSGVFLFPVSFALMAWQALGDRRGNAILRGARATACACGRTGPLVAISGLTLWATCWFSLNGPLKAESWAETPSDSPWIRVLGDGPRARRLMDAAHDRWKRPAPLAALAARVGHDRAGHSAYLRGEFSQHGWWYFFPLAWLLKCTAAELLITLAIVPLLIRRGTWARRVPSEGRPDWSRRAWAVAIVVYWLMVCLASINIGHRYLAILYPLSILLFVDLIWETLDGVKAARLVLATGLALTQIGSTVWIAPHYLAYFTPLIGGPSQGRHYLVDSSLDWGQDLIGLRRSLEQLGARKVLLQYFGTARPAAYGVAAVAVKDADLERLDRYDFIAISATHLQGLHVADDPFAHFRDLSPTARAGYSILIYDLRDPACQDACRQAVAELNRPCEGE